MSHAYDSLLSLVDRYLRVSYPAVYQDPDGDFIVDHGHIRIFLTPIEWDTNVTMVKVWTLVASGVNFDPSLAQYLNELNRKYEFGTFYFANTMVYYHQSLLVAELDQNELLWAVKIVAEITDEVDNDIQSRFGGVHWDWGSTGDTYYKPMSREEYEAPKGHSLGTVLAVGAVGLAAGAAIGYAVGSSGSSGGYGDYGDSGGMSPMDFARQEADREIERQEREEDRIAEMEEREEEWEEEMEEREEEREEMEDEMDAALEDAEAEDEYLDEEEEYEDEEDGDEESYDDYGDEEAADADEDEDEDENW